LAARIGTEHDTSFEADRARDHDDYARDHDDRGGDHDDRGGDQSRTKPFARKRGYQYAENYPDPITGHPLQTYPLRGPEEFDSTEDWLKYVDALTRWTNYLPPPQRIPKGSEFTESVPIPDAPRPGSRRRSVKSRHVGIRLTKRDFELLDELARAHAVRPGTMARMLIVRAVRAAERQG
jgi:hypothetical protein